MNSLFVHVAIEKVRSCNIDVPKIFGLPFRHRFWIHGCDVAIGEKSEHLQHLGRADSFRETANDFRFEEISAHSRGHFKMVLNEKFDGFSFLSR